MATATVFALAATGLERKVTWYLAIDQYGYLAFAHDLAAGRIFHRWPPIEALEHRLPPHEDFDVLSQTYVLHEGKLYCRYAPGFPMILAAWVRLFGSDAAHLLNPSIFLALMAVFLALGSRLLPGRPPWAALAGLLLLLLFPTYLHLWAITLVRDLSAHLCAFGALALLVGAARAGDASRCGGKVLGRGRAAAVGLLLGFAVSIRPDAVLYLLPAALILLHLRAGWRPLIVASALGLVGLAPLLAYNYIAVGNPLRPTQSMELRRFLEPPARSPKRPAAAAPRAGGPGALRPAKASAHGRPGARPSPRGRPPRATRQGYPPPPPPQLRSTPPVQGGGLRLANLPRTLRGNVALLRQGYGDLFLTVALGGALVAALTGRLLFLATVPYSILALIFFSCWVRPDPRYLAGLLIAMPLLVMRGLLALAGLPRAAAERLGPPAGRIAAVGAAAALALGAAGLRPGPSLSALPLITILVPAVLAAFLLASAVAPRHRPRHLAAGIALALLGLAVSRSVAGWGRRATFQRPEMLRARATTEAVLPAGAVVITTDTVGRPAENIDYYTHAHALYLVDLQRWGIAPEVAAAELVRAGLPPYLLIPPNLPGRRTLLSRMRTKLVVERIVEIPPPKAMDYFVAAPFHRGVWMELYRMSLRTGRGASSPRARPGDRAG